jgi:hypothetical protein
MEKLIVKFELNPTLDNANRIYKHERKHPMSVCALSVEQIDILDKAMEVEHDNYMTQWVAINYKEIEGGV